jgi:predicted glycoside hydrolase/deacetylase ChbG (UPF0249 family)
MSKVNVAYNMKNYLRKFFYLSVMPFLLIGEVYAQTQIIFRGDDMGFSHSANVAHIDAYKKGVVRSVEVIVPGPWFEEAVKLLNENPGLDVGVHLALTSEWDMLKWKPLTHAPSLVDENGYFHPFIWPNEKLPGRALKEHEWKIEEVEQELRAQIEMAMKRIPQVSHFTGHMGCTSMSEEVQALARKLAKEYKLEIFPTDLGFERLPRWGGKEYDQKQKLQRITEILQDLKPGKYLTVTHPAYLDQETKSVYHEGYMNVGEDRDAETRVLTSPELKDLIRSLGIEVIGYDDLR